MQDQNFHAGAGPAGPPDLGPTFGQSMGNMRFVGMAALIYGIMNCLSIVGAVVGIPMILAANQLLGAVKIFEEYRLTGLPNHLARALEEMGKAFGIIKILIIISLIFSALYLLFLFGFGGLAILSELVG